MEMERLNTKIPYYRNNTGMRSAVMTKNKRLVIVSGKIKNVDIFNIDNNEWNKCKEKVYGADVSGIYYDDMNDNIYVGGGYDVGRHTALKIMEYYNLEKNIWTALPDTNKMHDMYPLIWLEDYNNLLHIMSISSNCIEFIDLRGGENKKWMIKNDNVSKLFNTTFRGSIAKATVSRLIGN